jgi:hypothetical protein
LDEQHEARLAVAPVLGEATDEPLPDEAGEPGDELDALRGHLRGQ